MNASTPAPLVERVRLRGQDWLLYPALALDCVLLRGTTADEDGNVTTEDEAFPLDLLAMAQAGRNSGGLVIVQVKRIARRGSLDPHTVRVPGHLVDHVVVCTDPALHGITFSEADNAAFAGRLRVPDERAVLPLSVDKVIQRRAFLEMAGLDHPTINLGIGIPAGIGRVAAEEGFTAYTMTVESGVVGGIPGEELAFGAAANPTAVVPQASQFDFYDGGGLDIAFLGMAEADVRGAVNVSRFGRQVVGVGGFTNIAQSARRVVYVGAFTAGGADIAVGERGLAIRADGRTCKIVERVAQVSADPAAAPPGQEQAIVTERAVFRVRDSRLTLTEVAPGIDARTHVLERLPPGIAVAEPLGTMPGKLFAERPMREAGP